MQRGKDKGTYIKKCDGIAHPTFNLDKFEWERSYRKR